MTILFAEICSVITESSNSYTLENFFVDRTTTNVYIFVMVVRYVTIAETHVFEKKISTLLDEDDLMSLKVDLSTNPQAGDIIRGGNGLRKVRVAVGNKGKSGGIRVIYYFYNETIPLFLLDAYAKNQKENLSKSDLKDFAKLIEMLKKYGEKHE